MQQNKRQFLKQLTGISIFSVFGTTQVQSVEAKPYKEYFINRFSVAGHQYYIDSANLPKMLKPGGMLDLVAEPNNVYDKFAVKVFYKEVTIGYVPRSDNRHISRLLCQGAIVKCKVIAPTRESSLSAISVGVFLPAG